MCQQVVVTVINDVSFGVCGPCTVVRYHRISTPPTPRATRERGKRRGSAVCRTGGGSEICFSEKSYVPRSSGGMPPVLYYFRVASKTRCVTVNIVVDVRRQQRSPRTGDFDARSAISRKRPFFFSRLKRLYAFSSTA